MKLNDKNPKKRRSRVSELEEKSSEQAGPEGKGIEGTNYF